MSATRHRPLVSIITGCIPDRLHLLFAAMANIREQTYLPIEHCIVFEGDPIDTHRAVGRTEQEASKHAGDVETIVVGLGRWWSRYLAASESAVPFQVAQWLASGDYLLWWADDEQALVPDHIEALVDLLESTDSDFVYPYVRLWEKDRPENAMVIGCDPPRETQLTHCLFRADLLDYRGFMTHVGPSTDWDQVWHWMQAGARWAMLDRLTFDHRLDKHGVGPHYRAEQRPLRGHARRLEGSGAV